MDGHIPTRDNKKTRAGLVYQSTVLSGRRLCRPSRALHHFPGYPGLTPGATLLSRLTALSPVASTFRRLKDQDFPQPVRPPLTLLASTVRDFFCQRQKPPFKTINTREGTETMSDALIHTDDSDLGRASVCDQCNQCAQCHQWYGFSGAQLSRS